MPNFDLSKLTEGKNPQGCIAETRVFLNLSGNKLETLKV